MTDSPNGLHLILVWPPSILNPNVHVHWSKKHRAKVDLKEAWYYDTKSHGVELDPGKRYRADVVFCPPDNRVRDFDNLLRACKSGMDGMCTALRIDDSQIRPVPDWGPVVENGKVEITITEDV